MSRDISVSELSSAHTLLEKGFHADPGGLWPLGQL
jgi:hypothetical protein